MIFAVQLTKLIHMSRKTFNELIRGNNPVLVDFYAEWCGPCKMMAPVLKEVKEKVGEKVTIIKIDIDKNRETAEQFGIQGVPTFILFKSGEQKWRQSGMLPASAIEQVIVQYSD
jgi:thioredoxin 1